MKCDKKRVGGLTNTDYRGMIHTDPVRSQRYGVRKHLARKSRRQSVSPKRCKGQLEDVRIGSRNDVNL